MKYEHIKIPEFALVTLVGVSGSGKSTLAKRLFNKTEIVSSDTCRGIVSNDENSQEATPDAFELLRYILQKRLKNRLLTVVDATNVQAASRKSLVNLAKEYHCLPVAIVLDIPAKICQERNEKRTDRVLSKHVIKQQSSQLKKSIKGLKREGYRHVFVLKSEEEISQVEAVVREKLYNNKKEETGPFDIIGDIHGCFDELTTLLEKLGYEVETTKTSDGIPSYSVIPPKSRKAVFVGDLVDRGPKSLDVLCLVMSMVKSGAALCVPGNHDMKLRKYLTGKQVQLTHGLDKTVEQLKVAPAELLNEISEFLYQLVSHYILDEGRLVVAHAGLKQEMQGRGSGAVRSFCLYGETTGEVDQFGLPIRHNWAKEYRGKAKVVYGHTPVRTPAWLNNTLDIDTGCVFGGQLTALRYPENEIVAVPAKDVYVEPAKPLEEEENSQLIDDDMLDIQDVIGKRIISTSLRANITIQEENAITALETMSRFAVNPKWLMYLPPTMSPSETSDLPDFLEHPKEAIAYYAKQEIGKVVCQEKHMGSRAIMVICKDEVVVKDRFGIENDGIGKCYTRTGRNFFQDSELESAFIQRMNTALTKSKFWERMKTDWVCLDTEIMPWSAKAKTLLETQYAPVGAAAESALSTVMETFQMTRNIEGIEALASKYQDRKETISSFQTAYRQYCWEVNSLDDYQVAPFHILATEGNAHVDKNHEWHMQTIKTIHEADPTFILATRYQVVDVQESKSVDELTTWWLEMTERGGEGIVIKPFDFISRGKKDVVQPAIKCRGKEYLRIIYGPEYTLPDHLERLKNRGVSKKRSMAMREFALGVESLERFVQKMPLRQIHECVFGVLALESEAVDPRL